MLGLKRGTVKLVAYDKNWKKLFEKEKRTLKNGLLDRIVALEHVGSTAVPGMIAKPIIDMMLGLKRTKDAHALVRPLGKLGYEWREDSGNAYEWFFVKGPEARRTHYLHVVRYGGAEWNRTIRFRDALRTDREITKEYIALKRSLAVSFRNDRPKYTAGKVAFIRKVTD